MTALVDAPGAAAQVPASRPTDPTTIAGLTATTNNVILSVGVRVSGTPTQW
jgi:hypothetical protein